MYESDTARISSKAELLDLLVQDKMEDRALRNVVVRQCPVQHPAQRLEGMRTKRDYRPVKYLVRPLSGRRPVGMRFRRARRKAVSQAWPKFARRRAFVRVQTKTPGRQVMHKDQQTHDAEDVRKLQTQTKARFLGPDGRLRTLPATDSRIWSTANPYTLARIWPFQATPEATAQRWTYWERQYAGIASFYATYRKRREGETPQQPRLMGQAAQWADSVIIKLDSGQTIITIDDLHFQDAGHVLQVWHQVALWLITNEPERMIRFLLATNAIEELESHLIEDTLLQLARYFHHTNSRAGMRQLTNAFCTMAEQRPERRLVFRNEFIRIQMKDAPKALKHRLFETLKACNVVVHPYTWLHFATYFANHEQFELGLEALLIAHEMGVSWTGWKGYAFRSNCTTILRRSSKQPDGLRVCLRVVSTLVDIGVKFNLPICNVIMLNAIEAGDLKTAFAVYHSLKERGLKPDEVTFLVLLKGCRMNVDDAQLLDEIIRDAISNLNLWKSEKVATEILHCLALHHSKHNPSTALNTLAEAYAQLFDLAPLKILELPISPTLQARLSKESPMPPTRHAITFMIGATIQHYLATAPSPGAHTKQILDLYPRWRAHVSNESVAAAPLLASLATTDHVPNTFLSAFTRHPKTLILAARVVRDLERPLPPTAIVEQSKPTVHSWSIFLLGFTQHGDMKLAEQVLAYMRKKGIEPNHVTWNTLIRGYAQVQDAENTAATLREAEQAGMVWDVWTHKGLRRLRDRRKFEEEWRKLEEDVRARRVAERLDFTGELKEDIGLRLEQVQGDGQMEGFVDSAGEIAEQEGAGYRPFG